MKSPDEKPDKKPDKKPDINDIRRSEGVEGVRKKHDTAQKVVPINSSKPVPKTNGHAGLMDTTATIVTKKASDYTMAALDWLWPGRFALGKLGLIGGLPDRGKGLICCDLIACVTNNHPLPCNEGKCPQGNVIYFAAEDDGDDTVVPRLVAAGADLDKVHIVEMVDHKGKRRGFNLITDIDLLRKKIEEIGNVVLVIIDPISAYLPDGGRAAAGDPPHKQSGNAVRALQRASPARSMGVPYFGL